MTFGHRIGNYAIYRVIFASLSSISRSPEGSLDRCLLSAVVVTVSNQCGNDLFIVIITVDTVSFSFQSNG